MEENISAGDLVILGNRYEAQLCAIEMGAGCIIICDDVPVTLTITKLAKDNDCTVISSPHDAFTVSRLIFQSIPIGHVMKKEGLITFKLSDYVDDVKKVMAEKRHRDFPVLDSHNNYVGMISRRSLLISAAVELRAERLYSVKNTRIRYASIINSARPNITKRILLIL